MPESRGVSTPDAQGITRGTFTTANPSAAAPRGSNLIDLIGGAWAVVGGQVRAPQVILIGCRS